MVCNCRHISNDLNYPLKISNCILCKYSFKPALKVFSNLITSSLVTLTYFKKETFSNKHFILCISLSKTNLISYINSCLDYSLLAPSLSNTCIFLRKKSSSNKHFISCIFLNKSYLISYINSCLHYFLSLFRHYFT
jgi:hypothetical protein